MKIGVQSACLLGAIILLLVVYVVFLVREEPIYLTRHPVTKREEYYKVRDWIGGEDGSGGMCSGLLNNGSWTRNPVSVRCVFLIDVVCFRMYYSSENVLCVKWKLRDEFVVRPLRAGV